MKIRNLLVLSVVALLASCGPKPQAYDTTVNLPSGGDEVAQEEKDERASGVLLESFTALSNLQQFKIGGEFNLDASSSNKVDTYYDETTKVTTSQNMSFKGKVKFALEHDGTLVKDETAEAPAYSTILSLGLEGFSYHLKSSVNGQQQFAIDLNNLTVSLHYVYDVNEGEGYVLADLSHESVMQAVKPLAYSYADAMAETPQEQAAARAYIDGMLTDYLVTQGGKFFAKQSELVNYINNQSSDSALIPDDGGVEGLLPLRAESQTEEMINYILSGDIIGNALDMLQSMLPDDFGTKLATALPTLLASLPFVMKEYKDDAGATVEYGFGFNVNEQTAAEFINEAYKGISALMGGGEGSTHQTSGMPVPGTGAEEDPLNGIKFSVGFAMMIGNQHGSESMELESISLRFNLNAMDTVTAQGSYSLDLYYGDQVPNLFSASDFASYTIDAIELIEAMDK